MSVCPRGLGPAPRKRKAGSPFQASEFERAHSRCTIIIIPSLPLLSDRGPEGALSSLYTLSSLLTLRPVPVHTDIPHLSRCLSLFFLFTSPFALPADLLPPSSFLLPPSSFLLPPSSCCWPAPLLFFSFLLFAHLCSVVPCLHSCIPLFSTSPFLILQEQKKDQRTTRPLSPPPPPSSSLHTYSLPHLPLPLPRLYDQSV